MERRCFESLSSGLKNLFSVYIIIGLPEYKKIKKENVYRITAYIHSIHTKNICVYK